ncbi:DNA methyltransferase [Clostridium sp. DJ247]|uniref:DNA methyltransferase n=1 Tax=Clostridium sp. DJ247 TaxID=2726188 RepID=UPI0016297F20|nr:DNA methyltransferase [Clostridium sp. DJ247]MBC2581288.1 DUF1156 domain-containing protein [Clostridium sp. DJ247]
MVKMVDNSIPIKFISQLSRKEANSRKPVYKLHKWFGRKTDAIFRSILLALELEANELDNFNDIYYRNNYQLLKGKIILDPFMGGGSTVVNALRLGAKVVGIDINPVAWFITKNELQLPRTSINNIYSEEEINLILDKEFSKLEENIGNEIKESYKTTIYDHEKNIKRKVDIMYVLWVKKATCPKCGECSKLFPHYTITKLIKKNYENFNICPQCGEIVRGNQKELICGSCSYKFNNHIGIYKGRKFTCVSCNTNWDLVRDIMKHRDNPLDLEMYAIQYYDSETKKKGFKIPDKEDIDNYNKVKEKAINLLHKDNKFIPTSEIPEGYNTKQIINHNYKYWHQMFNYRQLYYLVRLLEEINKISDDKLKELFLCVFSNTINANNMFCIYNSQYGKIEPLFGDHHMAPVVNPVENNLWGTKLGRGSFIKHYKSLIQSKKFNYSPYERINNNGKNINIALKNERFYSEFAEDFIDLVNNKKNTLLKCQTAEDLSFIPNCSVDAVITDPPYYSAINYGEISEFFYIWDRIILKDKYNFFNSNHIQFNHEVTVNEARGISKEEFLLKLSKCFSEVRRVLKEDAPLILTYNNSSPEGWELMFKSLTNAGFGVEKTYPIHTELRAGLIDNKREKMNYDLIIVARAKSVERKEFIKLHEFITSVNTEFNKTMIELDDKELSRLDIILIKVGKVLELYSKKLFNVYKDERKMDLREMLDYFYSEKKFM